MAPAITDGLYYHLAILGVFDVVSITGVVVYASKNDPGWQLSIGVLGLVLLGLLHLRLWAVLDGESRDVDFFEEWRKNNLGE